MAGEIVRNIPASQELRSPIVPSHHRKTAVSPQGMNYIHKKITANSVYIPATSYDTSGGVLFDLGRT